MVVRQIDAVLGLCLATLIASGGLAADELLVGRWEGTAQREGRVWRLGVVVRSEEGKPRATADFPDYGVYGIRFGLIRRDNTVGLRGLMRESVVSFDGEVEGETIHGTFKATGADFTPRLIECGFVLHRSGPEPPRIETELLRARSGEVELAGTLVKPGTPGPHPAIVWTHGSGNQSRRTTFYASRPHLAAQHGVAALIFDKRGVGRSGGDWKTATLVDLSDDAIAWVDLLRKRDDIDPRNVGVGGMSQGGWIAPLAAARCRDVAFVVVGSAPGITPQEQNNFSVENRLKAEGATDGEVSKIMLLRRKWDRFWQTGIGRESVEAGLESARERYGTKPWYKFAWLPEPPLTRGEPDWATNHMLVDPAAVWQRVKVPTLAIWGACDTDVPAELSKRVFEKALKRAGNRDYTLRIFQGAGHGLRIAGSKRGDWDWPRLAPGYHDLMALWLQQRGRAADVPQ